MYSRRHSGGKIGCDLSREHVKMEPKYFVEFITSLALVFWTNKCAAALKCDVGRPKKLDVNYECFFPTETVRAKNNCHIWSCRNNETADWRIIDSSTGKLQIRFQNPPDYCKFDAYVVELETYDERMAYEEAHMCNTDSIWWVTHSRRLLKNNFCSNCSSQLNETECLKEHVVTFNYVYSGFYRVKVIPYVNGSTRQAQRSYRFYANSTMTNYVKKQFAGLNLNASVQYRSVSRELDIGIPLLIEQPPEAVKVEIKYSSTFNDLYSITVHENASSSDIDCDKKKNDFPWPSCQMHQAVVSCKLYNLTQGSYTIYVSFMDERCEIRTIWTVNHTDSCLWVIKRDFVTEETADSLKPIDDSVTAHILYTSIVIILLIGAIITSFIAKKISKKKKELSNIIMGKIAENASKNTAEQTYNFNSGDGNRFNFGHFLTLTERPKPEVLLVYAREAQPFMELIACLRRVLNKIFKCVVYDYFDPDLWNEVSKDPKGWVQELIVERQAKVIIVSSTLGAMQYRSVMGESPSRPYKTPHPFDHLFSYAIRLIRDGMNENSYKNLFVVAFDGITESNHMIEHFNPYTRFVIPKHLYKLFENLQEGDSIKNLDVQRLEEKHEVCQLRMQLDHLKNLKLFGNIDVDSRSLCN